MKILALRADSGGCAFYRLQEPARVVSSQFSDIDIEISANLDVDGFIDKSTGLTTVTEVQSDADVIIFQRPLNNAFYSAIKQAKRQGITTIVELDDDLETVHPKNIAYKNIQPKTNPLSNYEWIKKSALEADLVTVSTPYLTKFAPHNRFQVIRNYVPESIGTLFRADKPKTVGWSGTIQTHPTDLQVTSGAIWKSISNTDFNLYVVGDSFMVPEFLKIPDKNRVSSSGWVSLSDYYKTISDNIGIGIVPLDKGSFNQAKSWLKGLEFAALGIPFVASDTREYRILEAYGVGTVAKSPSDWNRYVSRLIKNDDKTVEISTNIRNYVLDNLTYEKNADLWYSAWTKYAK